MPSSGQLENQVLLGLQPGQRLSVKDWNPPFSGDIDICIKADGTWQHEGVTFTRETLADLFSSLLRKEANEYFLVTPVEKWRIRVEDGPLFVIDYVLESSRDEYAIPRIRMTTSSGDLFYLDDEHTIFFSSENSSGEDKPYVIVRDNLRALLVRNVFYSFSSIAVLHKGKYGVWSCGRFHALER